MRSSANANGVADVARIIFNLNAMSVVGLDSSRTSTMAPEETVRSIFETAMMQVSGLVGNQTREADMLRGEIENRDEQLAHLKSIVGNLEAQVSQLTAEAEASHSEAAETALALQKLQKESTARVSELEQQREDERMKQEATLRDLEAEMSEKIAAERAQNEIDFQELRKSFEEDLETNRVQMEEAAAAQVAEVEEVWGKRYADAKSKLEKAITEMRAMRQKAQEMRKMELEALDSSGKTLAQQMEEAMRLIRRAQDHSLTERLRYSSALLDDADCPSILTDQENTSIPSPSQIRAQYSSRKSSVPRPTTHSVAAH